MDRVKITDEQRQRVLAGGKLEYTPEQREEAFADNYEREAFDYALQYYGAARFSFAATFQPVASTLLHHAVEMLLKGCLAITDAPAQIRKYRGTYGHRLPVMWAALKAQHPGAGLHEFDDAIVELEKFSDIRFPESIAEFGGLITTGFADSPPPPPQPSAHTVDSSRRFGLDVRPIDKLVVKLFAVTQRNPAFYAYYLKHPEAARFFTLRNESPLLP